MLILLVQHISTMLQAPNIAAAAGAELLDVVRAEMPVELKSNSDRQTSQDGQEISLEADGYPVRVSRIGCVQYIDPDTIFTLARENNLVIHLLRRPGSFVWSETVIALILAVGCG